MKMFVCRLCGNPIIQPYGLCKSCTNKDVFDNVKIYKKSISKEQRFDRFGNPICIICGRVTKDISKHIRCHKMHITEYRKKFKIPKKVKLCNYKYTITEEQIQEFKERVKNSRKKHQKSVDNNTNMCYNKENNEGVIS